jgi:hypothetical protein
MGRFEARRPSRRLTFDDAVAIWHRLLSGELQSRIAAEYDVNQGRVAEIKKGRMFPDSFAVATGRARKVS